MPALCYKRTIWFKLLNSKKYKGKFNQITHGRNTKSGAIRIQSTHASLNTWGSATRRTSRCWAIAGLASLVRINESQESCYSQIMDGTKEYWVKMFDQSWTLGSHATGWRIRISSPPQVSQSWRQSWGPSCYRRHWTDLYQWRRWEPNRVLLRVSHRLRHSCESTNRQDWRQGSWSQNQRKRTSKRSVRKRYGWR